ncbi:HoxN/HupN/NixA family nickel/cobalt transporter [Deinococcus cellulosilyticus]|uniref:Nickel/cobalt efflux system n=1 Tax=Deinococcus cellulosilyticus (strain DSM 18568 / NBRC 106333 / KACC 11606 / 5516J-15) TaxID=1223518 RepID=A0A511MYB1_DEIC1|nr:high frequency lysogenization protein HflD [Deinococcus cellulosilyticus]GEM45572.1 nickel/cobalt efflux system [Deinococcus cellulosilyticus NBRC 106333 = KACC 11606]
MNFKEPYVPTVVGLHLLGLALLVFGALEHPLMWGLGLAVYGLGLRHAWDADHIAVIDNSSRKFLQENKNARAVGFYFAAGHALVVLLMSIGAALLGQNLTGEHSALTLVGSWVAPLVGGLYLLLLALVNLRSCLQIMKGQHTHGGLLARVLLPLNRMVREPWHLLPVGFLMGLGMETASEVTLLAFSGSAAQQGVNWSAILSLPLLFAAGMTLMDTLDGLLMTRAYQQTLVQGATRKKYNLLLTAVSGSIALVIGLWTVLGWVSEHYHALPFIDRVDVSSLGFVLAAFGLGSLILLTFRPDRKFSQ